MQPALMRLNVTNGELEALEAMAPAFGVTLFPYFRILSRSESLHVLKI